MRHGGASWRRAAEYVADHSYEALARGTLALYDRLLGHAHRD
jgi:hypothetical protein